MDVLPESLQIKHWSHSFVQPFHFSCLDCSSAFLVSRLSRKCVDSLHCFGLDIFFHHHDACI
jgi:hypothetical protein